MDGNRPGSLVSGDQGGRLVVPQGDEEGAGIHELRRPGPQDVHGIADGAGIVLPDPVTVPPQLLGGLPGVGPPVEHGAVSHLAPVVQDGEDRRPGSVAADEPQLREDRPGILGPPDRPFQEPPGELVRHGDPVQRRAGVVDVLAGIDLLVAEALPLGPSQGYGGHDGHGPVAGGFEVVHQGGPVAGQEEVVAQLVLEPEAAQDRSVAQPGHPALARGHHPAGEERQAPGRQRIFHGLQAGHHHGGVAGVLQHGGPVGLDESEDHVPAAQPPEESRRVRRTLRGRGHLPSEAIPFLEHPGELLPLLPDELCGGQSHDDAPGVGPPQGDRRHARHQEGDPHRPAPGLEQRGEPAPARRGDRRLSVHPQARQEPRQARGDPDGQHPDPHEGEHGPPPAHRAGEEVLHGARQAHVQVQVQRACQAHAGGGVGHQEDGGEHHQDPGDPRQHRAPSPPGEDQEDPDHEDGFQGQEVGADSVEPDPQGDEKEQIDAQQGTDGPHEESPWSRALVVDGVHASPEVPVSLRPDGRRGVRCGTRSTGGRTRPTGGRPARGHGVRRMGRPTRRAGSLGPRGRTRP